MLQNNSGFLEPLKNFFIPKQRLNPPSPSAFQMLEDHMVTLRGQHANVVRREVGLITIPMMLNLTRLEVTPERLHRNQPMNPHGLPVLPHSRVRIRLSAHGLLYPQHKNP